jgi:guanylate kinase
MKKTLFIIFGRSSTGKTETVREIMKNYSSQIKLIVTTTTRTMRPGEIDGVSYHFTDKANFERLILEDKFAEHVQQYGGSYYGTTKDAFDTSMVNIAIVEPTGMLKIKEAMSDKFRVVVIKMDENDYTLIERFNKRGDPAEVVNKRVYEDKHKYSEVPFDYMINAKPNLLEFILLEESDLRKRT